MYHTHTIADLIGNSAIKLRDGLVSCLVQGACSDYMYVLEHSAFLDVKNYRWQTLDELVYSSQNYFAVYRLQLNQQGRERDKSVRFSYQS
jgi:hypothetical protein